MRDNILASSRLLGALAKFKGYRIICLSSGGTVYGMPQTVPTPETHPGRPMNSYGIAMAAITHYIIANGRGRKRTQVAVVRYPHDLKRQDIYCYVALNFGEKGDAMPPSTPVKKSADIVRRVRRQFE